MKIPLMVKVYFRLRRGWKCLNKETQQQVKLFLLSQRRADGYLNAGGKVDAYYTQFGKLLEAVLSPVKVLWLSKKPLVVKESMGRDTIYGRFFAFLQEEMKLKVESKKWKVESGKDNFQFSIFNFQLSSVCCIIAMQHQTGEPYDKELVKWLKARQDETGGFYASEMSPIPDMLSTAVALFTLLLIGEKPQSAKRFIEAHWLDIGSFAPTLLDDYSDVEYLFYGLLALGSQIKSPLAPKKPPIPPRGSF